MQQYEALWTAVFQDVDLFWSPVLIPNFLPFLIGSDKTGWDHIAGSKFTLLSSYYTDHSGMSISVLQWIRSIAFVLSALRPCFHYFIYFKLQGNSCILLKVKCQSCYAFWVYFICLLFLLLPHQHRTPLCTLPSNTALFHFYHSLANILQTKQHFTFYIN